MKRTHLRHPASTMGRAACNIFLNTPRVTNDPAAVDCQRCRRQLSAGYTGGMINRVERKTTKRGT